MSNLSTLMNKVGCTKWPQRWEGLFDEVEADFRANGTIFTDPEYYQDLHDRLGILNKHLDLYKKAATEIGKDQDLSLFLALLCRALQDREYHSSDVKSFVAPVSDDNNPNFAYDMHTALALASEADMCFKVLKERNIPEEHFNRIMNAPEGGIDYYQARFGRPGYNLIGWNQLNIDCCLYNTGRLQIQIDRGFHGNAQVFVDENGAQMVLAHDITVHSSGRVLGSKYCEDSEGSRLCAVLETADSYIGYPINESGLVEKFAVALPKAQWKRVLKKDDRIVALHIPAGGGLTPDLVDDAINKAKEFLATYYPDYEYKAFTCGSWLLDRQLVDILGEETNISKFCKRFRPIPLHSRGEAVFNFVFHKPNMNFEMKDLPENTTLERKLKQHFLNGGAIYETYGYFF